MRSKTVKTIILFAITFLWLLAGFRWYSCGIKGYCGGEYGDELWIDIFTAQDGSNAVLDISVIISVTLLLFYLSWRAISGTTISPNKKDLTPAPDYNATDLKVVRGINSEIEALLKENGIKDTKILAQTETAKIETILQKAGIASAMHDYGSWRDQASLASKGEFKKLEKFQDLFFGS